MAIPRAAGPRLIATQADIRDGVRALRRKCRYARDMHDVTGDPPLRRNAAGFSGLARIIVGQQVSVASAAAIWGRLEAAVAPFDAQRYLALSDAALRTCGLSRGKVRTLHAVATALEAGELNLDALEAASDDAVHAALTGVHGIGPWTADIYILFCLGRRDAFAPNDLALQVAAQMVMELDHRPAPAALVEIAERWRPWRGVAARMLWAYYKVVKESRSGAPV